MHKTLYILGTACSRAKDKAVRQAAVAETITITASEVTPEITISRDLARSPAGTTVPVKITISHISRDLPHSPLARSPTPTVPVEISRDLARSTSVNSQLSHKPHVRRGRDRVGRSFSIQATVLG